MRAVPAGGTSRTVPLAGKGGVSKAGSCASVMLAAPISASAAVVVEGTVPDSVNPVGAAAAMV